MLDYYGSFFILYSHIFTFHIWFLYCLYKPSLVHVLFTQFLIYKDTSLSSVTKGEDHMGGAGGNAPTV